VVATFSERLSKLELVLTGDGRRAGGEIRLAMELDFDSRAHENR